MLIIISKVQKRLSVQRVKVTVYLSSMYIEYNTRLPWLVSVHDACILYLLGLPGAFSGATPQDKAQCPTG